MGSFARSFVDRVGGLKPFHSIAPTRSIFNSCARTERQTSSLGESVELRLMDIPGRSAHRTATTRGSINNFATSCLNCLNPVPPFKYDVILQASQSFTSSSNPIKVCMLNAVFPTWLFASFFCGNLKNDIFVPHSHDPTPVERTTI